MCGIHRAERSFSEMEGGEEASKSGVSADRKWRGSTGEEVRGEGD